MIIAFSGKKQSGKDTAGLIAQTLLDFPNADNATVLKYLKAPLDNPTWKVKRFADYLKKIVADLTGCSVEDMENDDIKNEVIYKKWLYTNKFLHISQEYEHQGDGIELYQSTVKSYRQSHNYSIKEIDENVTYKEINITRRTFLERIGTEVARQIHSQVWIDYLFKDYDISNTGRIKLKRRTPFAERSMYYPKWLITDTRFVNEAEKITKNGGILIRVIRNLYWYGDEKVTFEELKKLYIEDTGEACTLDYAETRLKSNYSNHESETALDNYKGFNYIINNNGTIEDLINKIREILITNKLI